MTRLFIPGLVRWLRQAAAGSEMNAGAEPIPRCRLSGGSMQRPGLKSLLADIECGSVDAIVVYQVGRLTGRPTLPRCERYILPTARNSWRHSPQNCATFRAQGARRRNYVLADCLVRDAVPSEPVSSLTSLLSTNLQGKCDFSRWSSHCGVLESRRIPPSSGANSLGTEQGIYSARTGKQNCRTAKP